MGAFCSCHARAVRSKLSRCASARAALVRFFSAEGSRPRSSCRFAWSRASRASLTPISGNGPIASCFSLPRKRYLNRHDLPPTGLTSRNRPPESASLRGFSPGFAFLQAASVSSA